MFDKLKQKFGDAITGSNFEAIDPWIEIAPEAIVEVCEFLRDDPSTSFDYLNSITVVDYCPREPGKKFPGDERIELVYHLWSVRHKHSLVLKAILPRWKEGREGELPEIPSVSSVWPAADWHEREGYDLGGVRFTGHPNLRRILCPEDWAGHPLRKDYEMPQEYHGIRGR